MRSRWSAPRPVTQHGSLTGRRVPDIRVWRGPRAAAVPAGFLGRALPQLRGTVEDHTLDSAALGTSRQVTIYRPPGPARPLPGCALVDGESACGFAWSLESAILARAVPPVLLVGVHNAPGRGQVLARPA
jgi:hypothetical protein